MNGSRSIDTVYELFGYEAASSLRGALWSLGLFAIAAVAGTLWVFHQAAQKGDGRLAWNYLLQLAILGICTIPVEIKVGAAELPDPSTGRRRENGVKAPLVLAVIHQLIDAASTVVTDEGHSVFLGTAFRWERLVAASQSARIHDPALATRFHAYLEGCYWPAIAQLRGAKDHPVQEAAGLQGAEPLREHDYFVDMMKRPTWETLVDLGSELYVKNCAEERALLLGDLRRHLSDDPVHRELAADFLARQESLEKGQHDGPLFTPADFEDFYLFRMIDNEAKGMPRETEIARLGKAVPGYSLADPKFDVAPYGEGGPLNIGEAMLAKGSASIAIADEFLGKYSKAPVAYYRFSLWAPYIYSFLVCFLIALFPFVVLWSLWPERWTALVNFFKAFLALKLVPVLWSWISAINAARAALSPADADGSRGTGDVAHLFPAIVALYLAAPMLSYFVVAGVTRAATNLGAQLLGQATGAGGGSPHLAGGAAGSVARQGGGAAAKEIAAM